MRLIDADELKKKAYMEENPYGETSMVVTLTDIKKAPTIDAVQVVRCENCKYFDMESEMCTWHFTFRYEVARDYFCTFGERKKENETD